MRDRSGVINAADPSLADRVAGSSAIRGHAHANAERAAAAVERAGPAKGFALSRWAGAPGRKRREVEYAGETLRCGVFPRVEVIRLSQSCAPANSPLPLARNCCGPKFPAVDRSGAPDRIRTCDLCLRRAALYPLSYGCFPQVGWACCEQGLHCHAAERPGKHCRRARHRLVAPVGGAAGMRAP